MDAINRGLKELPDNKDLLDARMKIAEAITSDTDEERAKRAREDPEIRNILMDPTIQQCLKEISEDPRAVARFSRDQHIMSKLNRLIEAGILQVR